VNPYRYAVSLRLWHPSRDLSGATKALGFKPARVAKSGEKRQTPKGVSLPGTWRESYWLAKLTPSKGIRSKETELERFLSKVLKRLMPRRAYISRIRASGGRAELFVGLFGGRNFGIELDPELLAQASRVGVALSLDVYP
jgi:hypothetical protein